MKVTETKIKVSELYQGYVDSEIDGVWGYDGKLNIRPAFQREFVYKDKQREEVLQTVIKGFPLNIMYWSVGNDGKYELLDGQQRTLSICKYINGQFSITVGGMPKSWFNLTPTEQQRINDYVLSVYVCEGTEEEKTEWFKIINIAGLTLKNQEILNAVYRGTWVSDARKWFSKANCPAYQMAKDYVGGELDRQDYLETVLKWIASSENVSVEQYMAMHQHDSSASELWLYFKSVINWVETYFPYKRKEMKGLPWGEFYNTYHNNHYNPAELEEQVKKLMADSDVTKKSGVYEFLLGGGTNERLLSLRAFDDNTKRSCYERQNGCCKDCGQHFELNQMHAHHKTRWCDGGHTVLENCVMLCPECHDLRHNGLD